MTTLWEHLPFLWISRFEIIFDGMKYFSIVKKVKAGWMMLSRKAENYLKAIMTIESEKGYARIKDIAGAMNVRAPSATEMVKRLDKEGYVSYVKYGSVNLTSKGNNVARIAENRHDHLKSLLMDIIHVPESIAEKDALVLEQQLHDVTIEKMKKYVRSRRPEL
ncbi:MAG: DtxR family transcriptional regulator, Mn-dependent transcriptional regulator [Methanolobus sp.]|jgi:DtxR family Mn-dependent transcriptional regulator|uniref:metal-dependent transcriptional regulator n=1 Tax=Methanolobus sp. TaxID=1874737 RepID=UPI0025845F6C|nr:metal-dependent transcriptional regulator [Methanolobus sp.]MDK2830396.1 DtxR family transcriptional regulator, Mn-dependent transcriptional regulator [Methanolobus sp.]MDK2938065.1 DtxR family transcriptional regulator, Mn-dependent transcriptional regulator [Methanolobus sp.]